MTEIPFDDGATDSLRKGLQAGFGEVPAPKSSILQLLQARACRRLGVHLPDSEEPEPPVRVSEEVKTLRDPHGRYQILGEIARGGMGVVYKGRDTDLGRDVAMKVLAEKYLDEPGVLERFVEEAQIGGQLQHPGIVPVYELGMQHDERPYFAMKLVKGETLAEQLTRRMDPGEDRRKFLGIFEQVCQTVAFAHARRVVHRDLKPANVMIGSFGEVQVVDWGLAKVLPKGGVADERQSALNAQSVRSVISTVRTKEGSGTGSLAGSVLGTPAYMPPEQASGDVDQMDRRSDVFGLGAMLCEILTGAPPYLRENGDLLQQAALADLGEARTRIESCGADQALVKLCLQCLSPARRARPESAREVVAVVEEYLSSLEERARAAELRAVEARVKARSTRILAMAAVLVLSLGGVTFVWLQAEANTRHVDAEKKVAQAMNEANALLGEARVAGLDDPGLWDRAMDSLGQAAQLADSPDVSQATKDKLQDDRKDAEAQQDAARMLARLTELRIPTDEDARPARWSDREARRLDAAYAAAFATYLDQGLDSLPVEDAVTALSRGGLAVQLAAALDHWALERDVLAAKDNAADPAVTGNLRRIARRLDPDDAWRNGLRDLLPRPAEKRKELEDLAEAEDYEEQPAMSVVLLGEALWRADAQVLAVEVYRRGQEVYADDFWMTFRLGLLLERLEEPRRDEAIQAYRIAAALKPGFLEARHRMGMALQAQGDDQSALRIYKRLIALEPEKPDWNRHVADTLARIAGRGEGISYLEGIVDIYPEASWAHAQLGQQLRLGGQLDTAIERIQIALELNPENPLAHHQRGLVLLEQGHLDEAILSLGRATELTPDSVPRFRDLANALGRNGQHEDAVKIGRRAVLINPDGWGALNALAHALQGNGEHVEALEVFQRLTELNPRRPQTEEAWLLWKLGNPVEALASYQNAVAVGYRPATARNGLAWFLATVEREDLRDAEQAVENAEIAVGLRGGNPTYNRTLSVALYRAGETEEALDALEMAMKLRSEGDMTDWLFMAMVLHRLDRKDEARDWLDRAEIEIAAMPEVDDELARFLKEARETVRGSWL